MNKTKTAVLCVVMLTLSLAGCTRQSPHSKQPTTENTEAAKAAVAPGTIVIKPQFAAAEGFKNGLAKVDIEGGPGELVSGYVDATGAIKINPKYSKHSSGFSEGLAAVLAPGDEALWGFVNKKGEVVIEPQFGSTEDFSDGTAIVTIGPWTVGKHGLINKQGQYLINPQYASLNQLSKDRFAFRAHSRDDPVGILDGQGKVVAAPQFESLYSAGEGFAIAYFGKEDAKRCGYIDLDGKLVVNPQFIRCGSFADGLAAVGFSDGGKWAWGYIDRTGRIVIKTTYPNVERFHEGLAAVVVGASKEDAKWGFIDKSGTLVIQPQFDEIYPFANGRAIVRVGGGFGRQGASETVRRYNKDAKLISGKWGVIDTSGRYIVNPRFDLMAPSTDRLAPVRVGDHLTGKWGFVQL